MNHFLIWFEQRSGSSMLVSMLNSHPEIQCRGEMFAALPVAQQSLDQKLEDVYARPFRDNFYHRRINLFPGHVEHPDDSQTVAQLAAWFDTNQMIRGFKLKHPSQFGLYPEVYDWLVANDDLKVIVLQRNNFLRRAISLFNMQRLQSETRQSNSSNSVELEPLRLDLDETLRLIKYYQASQEAFEKIANRFQTTFHVTYKQLTDDSASKQTLDEIQTFLGAKKVVTLTAKTKKITPLDLRQAIDNFESLSKALQNEGLEYLLDEND